MIKFSSEVLSALKNALSLIYFKKNDLWNFIYFTIDNKSVMMPIDWEGDSKKFCSNNLINLMTKDLNTYQNDLLSLFDAIIYFNDFSHFKKHEFTEERTIAAIQSIEALQSFASEYFTSGDENERRQRRESIYNSMRTKKFTNFGNFNHLYITKIKDQS